MNHAYYLKYLPILGFLLTGILLQGQYHKDSVALTPPMGWNSWNCFDKDIHEEKIKGIADAMVNSGMKDAGYEYVIIDNGWMTEHRDENGHIIVDSVKFPNGIKALADYIHSLGLKFGIYSSPGRYTCGGKLSGSLGYEQIDANDYAAWGVDFLKYDWCGYPGTDETKTRTYENDCRAAFELMAECLRNTGRPVVYSVHAKCTGLSHDYALPWISSVANMFRTSGDIKDTWEIMLNCLESTADLWQYARPGYWNDPDMLEVGNTNVERIWALYPDRFRIKMTTDEYRTHFSMWCIVAAPLITGNDLRTMTPEIIEILTNKEIIAVNQDPLGKQGRRIRDDGDQEVWVKELSGDRKAVALFNRGQEPADITVNWYELGFKGKFKVRDLWAHQDLGKFRKSFTGRDIPGHVAMILLIEK